MNLYEVAARTQKAMRLCDVARAIGVGAVALATKPEARDLVLRQAGIASASDATWTTTVVLLRDPELSDTRAIASEMGHLPNSDTKATTKGLTQ